MSVLTLRLLRLFLLLALARLFVRDPIQRLVRNSDIHAFRLESGQKDVQSSGEHWLEFLIAWHADNAGALFLLSRSFSTLCDEKSLIGMDTGDVRKFIVVNALPFPVLRFRSSLANFSAADPILPLAIVSRVSNYDPRFNNRNFMLRLDSFRLPRVNRYEIRLPPTHVAPTTRQILEIKKRYFDHG